MGWGHKVLERYWLVGGAYGLRQHGLWVGHRGWDDSAWLVGEAQRLGRHCLVGGEQRLG